MPMSVPELRSMDGCRSTVSRSTSRLYESPTSRWDERRSSCAKSASSALAAAFGFEWSAQIGKSGRSPSRNKRTAERYGKQARDAREQAEVVRRALDELIPEDIAAVPDEG